MMKTLLKKNSQSARIDELLSSSYAARSSAEEREVEVVSDTSAVTDAALGEPIGIVSAEKKKKSKKPFRPNREQKRSAAKAERKAKAAQRAQERHAQNINRWYSGKRNFLLDKLGTYELLRPEIRSTTRQMEAGQLAVSQSPTGMNGLLMGTETEGDWPVCHDTFTSYGVSITSPNTAVLGDVGAGKSSFMKTWCVLRPLMLGRRVVILDKKSQTDHSGQEIGVGEYTPLARRLGVEPIRFVIGGGEKATCINILDPAITAAVNYNPDKAAATAEGNPANQAMLLRSIIAEVLGRSLSPKEGKALRVAHKRALYQAKEAGRVAVISDIIDLLKHPHEEDATDFGGAAEDLRAWGLDPAFELERMVEDDLAGLFDGPTTQNVSLTGGLMVFDLSALPESGPALSVVMTIINTWLANMLRHQKRIVPTHLVVEEAWHLVRGSFAEVTRQNTKLSRGLGLSSNFAFHHLSDIPADSPAIAMIKECDTILCYRQARSDDGQMMERLFDFPAGTAQVLQVLQTGVALCKIGTKKPFVLNHLRSDLEKVLTDTDAGMTSTAITTLV